MARSFAIDLGKLHASQLVQRVFGELKEFSIRVSFTFATHSTPLVCPDHHDKNEHVKPNFLSPCVCPQKLENVVRGSARNAAKLKGNHSTEMRFLLLLKTAILLFQQYLPKAASWSLWSRKLERIFGTASRTVRLHADCDD